MLGDRGARAGVESRDVVDAADAAAGTRSRFERAAMPRTRAVRRVSRTGDARRVRPVSMLRFAIVFKGRFLRDSNPLQIGYEPIALAE